MRSRPIATSTACSSGPSLGRVASSCAGSEVLEYLLRRDLTGQRIAVQLHGEPVPDLVQALEAAGAELIEVPVYRWVPPEDVTPLRRFVGAVAARQVDAVAFTSAPAAASFLQAARDEPGTLDALRDGVLACCVGPVTATPLQRADVPVVAPDRPRLGALVRAIAAQVPARCGVVLPAAGHTIGVRGHVAVVDGEITPLGATAMSLLRVLARHPGRVVSRADGDPGDRLDPFRPVPGHRFADRVEAGRPLRDVGRVDPAGRDRDVQQGVGQRQVGRCRAWPAGARWPAARSASGAGRPR